MSASNPPDPNVNTFNNLYWISGDTALTQDVADKRYLRFPTAQGTENLAAINVNGIAGFNDEIVQTGATNNILQDLTTNTNQNLLKATDIYGDLNLKKPTTTTGGTLTLYDIVAGVNTNQIYTSGTTLEIVNSNNSGTINFNTKDGAGVSTTPLQVASTLTTLSNPVSLTSATPPVSSQVIPATNDSSTKIPTTAWVQSAISAAPSPSSLTLNTLTINNGNGTSQPSYGINTNGWNTGGSLSFTGTGGRTVSALATFCAGTAVRIDAWTQTIPPARSALYEVNFTFFNGSNWGQTFCYLQLYPNRFYNNTSLTNEWNINNKIQGNANYNVGTPTYAPNGRMYWTYQQNFSGVSGANAWIVPFTNYVEIFFSIPDNSYSFECNVRCLDATAMTSQGRSFQVYSFSA